MKLDSKALNEFGRLLVKLIKEEIKKDALKSTFIPRSKDFYESFSYAVEGSSVAVYSTWPWIDVIVEGTPGPYKMKWLTQDHGLTVIPLIQSDGRMVFRTVPRNIGGAWVHPKIAQHTFIHRAFERAFAETAGNLMAKAFENVVSRKR